MQEARAESQKLRDDAERHSTIIARLTGENVLMVMTIEDLQARLRAAEEDRLTLFASLQDGRDEYLDQAKGRIEQAVLSGLVCLFLYTFVHILFLWSHMPSLRTFFGGFITAFILIVTITDARQLLHVFGL